MSPFDSPAFWTAVVAGVLGVGGVLAQRVPRRSHAAEAEMTLGHGWSEFAAALRDEAREERALRHEVTVEANECRERLAVLEEKCERFERHLRSLGVPLDEE